MFERGREFERGLAPPLAAHSRFIFMGTWAYEMGNSSVSFYKKQVSKRGADPLFLLLPPLLRPCGKLRARGEGDREGEVYRS